MNQAGRRLAAVALAIGTIAALSGCGNDGTTTVGSTTTTAKPTASSQPSSDAYDGLVETLTKMGISEKQARCVVEKMDEASSDIGDPGKLNPDDKTNIEKLLEECSIGS